MLQTTAMRYDWVSRTEAYDMQQAVAAMTNDPVQLLAQVREGLLERFQRLLAEGFADLKAEMTVKLLIEILLVEIAQQRTVGEATTPQDLADVSMETLLAVEHALTKKLSAVGARKKN